MTMGPYQATGSRMGRPETRRKRTGLAGVGNRHLVAVAEADQAAVAADTFSLKIKIIIADNLVGKGVTLRIKIAFPVDDIGKGGMAGRDGMMKFGAGGDGDIEIFRVGDDILDRPDGAVNLTADDFDFDALIKRDFGNLMALNVSIAGGHHLVGSGEVGPELKAVHAAPVIALGHFLVNDAAAGGHPLHVPWGDHSFVAQAVAMFHFPGCDISNGLNSPVGMPGEAFQIIGGIVAAEIIQEEKRVKFRHLIIAKGPVEVDPGPFQGGFALPDFGDFSDGGHVRISGCA